MIPAIYAPISEVFHDSYTMRFFIAPNRHSLYNGTANVRKGGPMAKDNKMSASEAGQKGGKAYHEKRGEYGSDSNTNQEEQSQED